MPTAVVPVLGPVAGQSATIVMAMSTILQAQREMQQPRRALSRVRLSGGLGTP
jgi:hypothetical protein